MKRLVSMVLVLLMLLSMLPISAFADSYTVNYRGNALMAVNTNTSTFLQSSSVAVASVSTDPEVEAALEAGLNVVGTTEEGVLVDAKLPPLEPLAPGVTDTVSPWKGVVNLPIADDADEEPLPEDPEDPEDIPEDVPGDNGGDDDIGQELIPSNSQQPEEETLPAEPLENELLLPTITVQDESCAYTADTILSDDGAPIIEEYLPLTMADSGSYSTSTYKYFYELRSNGNLYRHYMKCVYVGTYCTVWADYSANSNLRLSASNAAAIGRTFDSKFKSMQNTFGSYWYDADKDRKVALMCYDIDNSYGTGSTGSYVGGYFWAADMVSASGRINGINYGTSNYVQSGGFSNGLDCVSIDTYPAMGSGTPFSNISNCYSTLFHELQHMLNFSYQVKNGTSGYYNSMEVYLNEAFSTASEHLMMGSDSVKSRVTFFNGSNYVQGSSLSYWYGDGGYNSSYVLSNYTNSYLFGQYIRTRYDMLYPGYGDTIYKQVLTRRNSSNAGNTLGIIASLLKTTKEDLITDFWQAVYMKMDTGIYGFGGESWADALKPKLQSKMTTTNAAVHGGGAKFYNPGSSGIDAVVIQENIQLRSLFSGTSTGPGIKSIEFNRTGPKSGILTIVPTDNCTMYYTAVYGNVTSKSSLNRSVQLVAGQAYSINYNENSGLQSGTSPNFYYYLTSSSGSSALLNLKFPLWEGRYVDVPTSAWYASAVEFVTDHGIMNGTSATRFNPDGVANRGMLVTMLYRMEGEPSIDGYSNPFRDVPSNKFYYEAALWAYHNGIVNGTSSNTFSPDLNISREQTVTMLYRYANFKEYDTSAVEELTRYPDNAKVSGWAADAFQWAVAEGIISGGILNGRTYLQPQGNTTRAQMATIFQRFYEKYVS